MNCIECKKSNIEQDLLNVAEEAKWLLINTIVHNRILPLCDEHLENYTDQFGEDELDFLLIDKDGFFLEPLVKNVNDRFKWYENMQKILYAKIARLEKISKLDWINK